MKISTKEIVKVHLRDREIDDEDEDTAAQERSEKKGIVREHAEQRSISHSDNRNSRRYIKMKLALVLLLAAVAIFDTEAKTFTRCDLVRELRNQGFPEDDLRNWVCLVESESSRSTSAVSKKNKNGSRDYGLFQINDKYWCSTKKNPGKDCNVLCSQLITDDITKASTCAKKIFKRHGFDAWYGWKSHCQGTLPDIKSC
ncbi:unnamed protein product [Leptosia nina]|uniref:Lysozyme n=1 Tax=Leptosia nina TaxID=320188 RepID=A0AAV1IU87_9NEOP